MRERGMYRRWEGEMKGERVRGRERNGWIEGGRKGEWEGRERWRGREMGRDPQQ
jgi:hypothetical protein